MKAKGQMKGIAEEEEEPEIDPDNKDADIFQFVQ